MSIEEEVFKRAKINFQKITNYGFIKKDNTYTLSKKIDDNFEAIIEISSIGIVNGKIIDLDIEEEYVGFRIENQRGEFVNRIRDAYIQILQDIKNNCFEPLLFINKQTNRIVESIKNTYHDNPCFLWDSNPGFGVFKNPLNNKWYGIIMNIDRKKLDKEQIGEVEVINLKIDDNLIPDLLLKEGVHPAYHMNKKKWISITLDDSLDDEEILKYINMSHQYTETPKEWLIPANPKFFDIIEYFNTHIFSDWKQPRGVKLNDIVYIYVGNPFSAILYKCEVVEVDIPYKYEDKNLSINLAMKIKLLKKYNKEEYSFSKIKEYGITSIRGPRSITESLSKQLK